LTDRRKHKKKDKPPKNKIGKRVVKSNFEWATYHSLKAHLPRGADVEYETEKLKYIIEKDYTPDFIITFRDDTKLYIETKGYFPYEDREKMVAVKKANPDLDIRVIFYSDSPSKLGRGTKMKPSEWAVKYGFPFAIGEIPKDWLLKENDIEQ
jgi:hypothetical protein